MCFTVIQSTTMCVTNAHSDLVYTGDIIDHSIPRDERLHLLGEDSAYHANSEVINER